MEEGNLWKLEGRVVVDFNEYAAPITTKVDSEL